MGGGKVPTPFLKDAGTKSKKSDETLMNRSFCWCETILKPNRGLQILKIPQDGELIAMQKVLAISNDLSFVRDAFETESHLWVIPRMVAPGQEKEMILPPLFGFYNLLGIMARVIHGCNLWCVFGGMKKSGNENLASWKSACLATN